MVRVLVCVTRQHSCERLINTGAKFASTKKGELFVVNVTRPGGSVLESGLGNEGEALDYLFSIVKECGAEMAVLRSEDVLHTLVNHAREKKVTHIILGVSPEGSSTGIAVELEKLLTGVQVISVPA